MILYKKESALEGPTDFRKYHQKLPHDLRDILNFRILNFIMRNVRELSIMTSVFLSLPLCDFILKRITSKRYFRNEQKVQNEKWLPFSFTKVSYNSKAISQIIIWTHFQKWWDIWKNRDIYNCIRRNKSIF